MLHCTVEVDPHGDRQLSFKVEKEPVGKSEESDAYKHYLLNKAIHSALEDRGLVRDEHGDYPGAFAESDEPRVPGTPLNAKSVGKALGYKDPVPLFPFGDTLKVTRSSRVAADIACCMLPCRCPQDMVEWVSAGVKARRAAEADTLPAVERPDWTPSVKPKKKKKASAGSKRRRDDADDGDAE